MGYCSNLYVYRVPGGRGVQQFIFRKVCPEIPDFCMYFVYHQCLLLTFTVVCVLTVRADKYNLTRQKGALSFFLCSIGHVSDHSLVISCNYHNCPISLQLKPWVETPTYLFDTTAKGQKFIILKDWLFIVII